MNPTMRMLVVFACAMVSLSLCDRNTTGLTEMRQIRIEAYANIREHCDSDTNKCDLWMRIEVAYENKYANNPDIWTYKCLLEEHSLLNNQLSEVFTTTFTVPKAWYPERFVVRITIGDDNHLHWSQRMNSDSGNEVYELFAIETPRFPSRSLFVEKIEKSEEPVSKTYTYNPFYHGNHYGAVTTSVDLTSRVTMLRRNYERPEKSYVVFQVVANPSYFYGRTFYDGDIQIMNGYFYSFASDMTQPYCRCMCDL